MLFIAQALFYRYRASNTQDDLYKEATYFITVCSEVQQLALATGKEQLLFIAPTEREYSYPSHRLLRTTRTLSKNIFFGAPRGVFGPPGKPLREITSPISFEGYNQKKSIFVIRFSPQGTMSAGTLYLMNHESSCIALSHSISPYAPFRVYKLEQMKWKEVQYIDFLRL